MEHPSENIQTCVAFSCEDCILGRLGACCILQPRSLFPENLVVDRSFPETFSRARDWNTRCCHLPHRYEPFNPARHYTNYTKGWVLKWLAGWGCTDWIPLTLWMLLEIIHNNPPFISIYNEPVSVSLHHHTLLHTNTAIPREHAYRPCLYTKFKE